MPKNVLLTLLLTVFLFTTTYGGESNTYIRLHDTLSYDLSMAEEIIRSAGGKMKHQFPPNEIICYLPEVDFSGRLPRTNYLLVVDTNNPLAVISAI